MHPGPRFNILRWKICTRIEALVLIFRAKSNELTELQYMFYNGFRLSGKVLWSHVSGWKIHNLPKAIAGAVHRGRENDY